MNNTETAQKLKGKELEEFARILYDKSAAEFCAVIAGLVRSGAAEDYERIAVMTEVLPLNAAGKWFGAHEKDYSPSADRRYVDMFVSVCASAGVGEDEYIAVLLAAQYAEKGTALRGWDKAADAYIAVRAGKDFDSVADMLDKHDKKFGKYGVLLSVDKKRATERLMNKVLNGKHIDKTALRNVLMDCIELADELKELYYTSDAHGRVAVVRLLLLYKGDGSVREFLNTVVKNDKSKSVRALLDEKPVGKKADAVGFFENLMTEGKALPYSKWAELFKDAEYAAVADKIFFGMRTDVGATGVFVYNKGYFLDMSDRRIVMSDDSMIFVLHPIEVPAHAQEILSSEIRQPFLQIGRPVFHLLSGEDHGSYRVFGAMIARDEFDRNFKRCGFVFCDKRSADEKDTAFLKIGEYCMAVQCEMGAETVSGGGILFYSAGDTVRLNRKLYVSQAKPLACRDVPRREFSEFIYAAYRLFGSI